jgi:hypothetical protein
MSRPGLRPAAFYIPIGVKAADVPLYLFACASDLSENRRPLFGPML